MAGCKGAATLFLLGLVICGAHLASAQRRNVNAQRRFEQDTVNTILDPNSYDKRVNPGGNETGSGPTEVEVNMYVRRMNVVDIPEGQLKVQLTFRQRWNDPRLTYSRPGADEKHKFISVPEQEKVWTPDLFVSNEMESNVHQFVRSNSYIRIFPNGDVLSSVRVSLTLSCPMVFKTFPFDRQTCAIRFASYGSTNQDIAFHWKKVDPIQVTSELHMQRFSLLSFTTNTCDSQTITGIYSCLNVNFELKRLVSYYLVQVFIPCTMLVILGYLVFWLAPKEIVARLVLVVATLLVLATQVSRMNDQFPLVNYTKAIDVWTGISLTFVFIALVETIVVNVLSRRESENGGDGAGAKGSLEGGDAGVTDEDLETEALKPETDEEKGGEKQPPQKKKLSNVQIYAKRYWSRIDQQPRSQKTDIVFRIVYPVFFALFALIYAVVYCPN